MKWTGSCGLIHFIFHQMDSFLSHITAIPLSTLVAESQVPLNSVQCTLKQVSLKLEVTSCESPATIYRKTIILALNAGSDSMETSPWILHIHWRARISLQRTFSLWFRQVCVWQDKRFSRRGKAWFGFAPHLFLACPLSEQDGTK